VESARGLGGETETGAPAESEPIEGTPEELPGNPVGDPGHGGVGGLGDDAVDGVDARLGVIPDPVSGHSHTSGPAVETLSTANDTRGHGGGHCQGFDRRSGLESILEGMAAPIVPGCIAGIVGIEGWHRGQGKNLPREGIEQHGGGRSGTDLMDRGSEDLLGGRLEACVKGQFEIAPGTAVPETAQEELALHGVPDGEKAAGLAREDGVVVVFQAGAAHRPELLPSNEPEHGSRDGSQGVEAGAVGNEDHRGRGQPADGRAGRHVHLLGGPDHPGTVFEPTEQGGGLAAQERCRGPGEELGVGEGLPVHLDGDPVDAGGQEVAVAAPNLPPKRRNGQDLLLLAPGHPCEPLVPRHHDQHRPDYDGQHGNGQDDHHDQKPPPAHGASPEDFPEGGVASSGGTRPRVRAFRASTSGERSASSCTSRAR